MSANIDVLNPNKRKKVLLVAANPSVSKQTGWPIGFWAAELTHPYFEFIEKGYEVDIYIPELRVGIEYDGARSAAPK